MIHAEYPEADEWAFDSNPRISKRWHMTKDGQTYIMYGEQMDVLKRAVEGGYNDVTASGYWTSDGNLIVDSKDGPFVFSDRRPSGRLYSQ